jgi:cyanate permease
MSDHLHGSLREEDDEFMKTPLLTFAGDVEGGGQEFAVYPRRFWLLFLLSVTSMQQSSIWMSWSPVVDQVHTLYGWSTGTVDLLAAWGPIIYVPLAIFTADLVERLGLRASITLGATLSLTGAVIRSITTQAPYALALAHIGQILNAAAGPIVMSTPSKLSAEWFPPVR